jgi:3-methyladenine DNA glycosylase AlkD
MFFGITAATRLEIIKKKTKKNKKKKKKKTKNFKNSL